MKTARSLFSQNEIDENYVQYEITVSDESFYNSKKKPNYRVGQEMSFYGDRSFNNRVDGIIVDVKPNLVVLKNKKYIGE